MTNTDSSDEAILVALGSNLPDGFLDCEALLEAAVGRLPGLAVQVLARSGWWRSQAWPDPAYPPFVNGVVRIATPLPPRSLLGALLGLEGSFGRIRGAPNAPRTLDLDLIAYGRAVLATPGLTLPHPSAFERRFVTGPLAQMLPDWRHPVNGRSAAELDAAAAVGRDAAPVAGAA
ncbi:MAG TPA: 2-amino-4-hydroxy-6-hydroxymethyldihydropteridine diphosphokinase [Caulobacteraceae bacterium]|nr:2-amino-4-hydroxy-6-hydroxymethyldihydropteridine diphosphokinase [Caulobacteraceae bacterium]